MGEPATIGFTIIGSVLTTTGDGVTSFGQSVTDLFVCARCGSVIADDQKMHHVNWHAAYSLERWDDIAPADPGGAE